MKFEVESVEIMTKKAACGHFRTKAIVGWKNGEWTEAEHPECFDDELKAAQNMKICIDQIITQITSGNVDLNPGDKVQIMAKAPATNVTHESNPTLH